jgi:hypothetical protein
MQIGDRIRVKESVIVYHHPEHRNQPFDLKGSEGEIVEILKEWQGRVVSANYPYIVRFSKKFRAHLQDAELEAL